MAFVRVEQRNARLAARVRLDIVQGKDGPISKGTAVAISNVRKGSGEGREEEATSIQWTFWGKLAETASEYLGKGSRVNIIGRVQNNNYEKAPGELVYGLTFTCEATGAGSRLSATSYFASVDDMEQMLELMAVAPEIVDAPAARPLPPASGRGRRCGRPWRWATTRSRRRSPRRSPPPMFPVRR